MSDYRQHIALVRTLCAGTEALCEELHGITESEQTAFLEFLRQQQLGPWLNPVLANEAANEALPPAFLERLRRLSSNCEARTIAVISQARELQRGLLDREIEALFFKGIALGSEAYGDVHRRHQSDVDLMVDRSNLRAVVALLEELGYDTQRDGSTGEDLEARLRRMLERSYANSYTDRSLKRRRGNKKRVTACSLNRGRRDKVDLHCSLRVRYEDSVDFRALIDDSKDVEIEGMLLRGPSREATLLIQLLLIADDLRRSACKAKLFLDLYLLCRGLEPEWSWEAFFEARRSQRLEKLSVNVCALLLDLWDCSEEFSELSAAVDRRAGLLEIASPAEADSIIARPRGNRANRRLNRRIYPGGTAGLAALRFATDLPHAAARLAGLRRSQYRFAS